MWNRLKTWLRRHGLTRCRHDWVQAREFFREYEGRDYGYLDPMPMRHHPDWQANAYVCRKCHETRVAVEKIADGQKIGRFTDDLRV